MPTARLIPLAIPPRFRKGRERVRGQRATQGRGSPLQSRTVPRPSYDRSSMM
ncbi:hypothetical protein [Paracoccus angustae]|uniref:hypothetical protein n=1 Tax=Paracoccus angustae TaxID=1671480 RepID=UPI003672F73C